jgi:hypothetical protein
MVWLPGASHRIMPTEANCNNILLNYPTLLPTLWLEAIPEIILHRVQGPRVWNAVDRGMVRFQEKRRDNLREQRRLQELSEWVKPENVSARMVQRGSTQPPAPSSSFHHYFQITSCSAPRAERGASCRLRQNGRAAPILDPLR